MATTPSPDGWHGKPVDEDLLRVCAHNLLAAVDEAIYFKDLDSRFILVSRGQARRLGAASPSDVIGRDDSDFFGPEHAARARADEARVLATGEPLIDNVEEVVGPDGVSHWVTATKMVLRALDGTPIGTFGISHDITRQLLAERDAEAKSAALAASHAELERAAAALERRAAELAAIADVARAAYSNEDVRTAVCAAARKLSDADVVGLLEPDGKGNLTLTAQSGVLVPKFSVPLSQPSLLATLFVTGEAKISLDVNDEPGASKAIVRMVEDIVGHRLRGIVYLPLVVDERRLGLLVTVLPDRDVDIDQTLPVLGILAQEAASALDRADLHRRLQEQATQDVLTGLANRRAILDQLDQAVARSRRHNRGLGLLYLDLDGFKTVNDTYGHAAGDGVLVEVANRLRDTTRIEDNCGRIGGDEFVVICEDLEGEGESLKARLAKAITAPYTDIGVEVPIGASIGIAVWRPDDDADTLLARADHEMYADKAARGAWPGSMPSSAVLKSRPRV